MIEKPLWIQQFDRPSGTEIKHINGHWYLYERKSVYDPVLKRKRKKSGHILGAITENGFQPSKRQSPLSHIEEIENKEYGATAFLMSLTDDMLSRLRKLFPEYWREIYVMALLKCKEQSSFKHMEFYFQTSFLEQVLGPVSLSSGRITELLQHLGTDRESIRNYMETDIPDGEIIMFDGHRIISGSEKLEYAHVGYDSCRRFPPQVNLLYMFSLEGGKHLPVFYKQYSGDVPDVTAFSDIIKDTGISRKSVTVIADKRFESEYNEELLSDECLNYVLAVRRGCIDVNDLPDSPDKYQKVFEFRGRAIYCNEYLGEKENTFLFYDMSLANDEAVDFINRREKKNKTLEKRRALEDRKRTKGTGKLTQEEYSRLQPVDVAEALQKHRTNGTFILKTNKKELNCAQVFYLYQTRQDMEQAFKCYDDTLDCAASYMRNQYSFEAWLFINHLALQMLYAVTQAVMDRELTSKYSFMDVMQFLKHIRVNKINGEWLMTKVTKYTTKLCQELDIDIVSPLKLLASLK